MGIRNFRDLLEYYPFRYEDRRKITAISDLGPSPKALIRGKISSINEVGSGRSRRLVAELEDASGSIELVWFKGISYMTKYVKLDEYFTVYGSLNRKGNYLSIVHPEMSKKIPDSKKNTLTPIYPGTETAKKIGIDSAFIGNMVSNMLQKFQQEDILDLLPQNIQEKFKLIPLAKAYQWMHFPPSVRHHKQALRRLKFEELFWPQVDIAFLKLKAKKKPGNTFSELGTLFHGFYAEHIPFELTDAQKRVLKEIRRDTRSGQQMNRLIQGDVGSGKTMVALLSMLMALDNGYQACLMAPTEILAQQHYFSFLKYLEPLGIQIAMLSSSTKKKRKREILDSLRSGEIQIIIGTHALIEPSVKFANLGLAVIDEQHKFGVAQRARLAQKNTPSPHIMVLTATPIPRSLALTIYGQLDVSRIDQLPQGRRPIKTKHALDSQRMQVMDFLRGELKKGRQAYIVYPLIEESEKLDYESLERGYEEVKSYFPKMEHEISLVHGRQDLELRETNMRRFVEGRTKILVATTVIEVGVDVPNASTMIIESSERFGLSQLHQLRGRVGRGSEQSYCVLMTGSQISEQAKKRVDILCRSTDGFYISEEDMKLRGPGNMLGTQQSGALEFRLVDLVEDQKVLEAARSTILEILEEDSGLRSEKNSSIRQYMKMRFSQDWSEVI